MPKDKIREPLPAYHAIAHLFGGDTLIRRIDRADDPWFMVHDFHKIICMKNPSQAVKDLPDDEKARITLINEDGIRGNPTRIIVSESGMYALIMRCREAMQPGTRAFTFRRWVTGELLPTIRKTGRYELPHGTQKPADLSMTQKRLLVNTAHRLGGKHAGIELWNKLGMPPLNTFTQITRQGRFSFLIDLDETPPPSQRHVN